ncbi:MAG TPA: DUF5671 domain-containing protein [Bryobacteraceae bacterium]|nr:DUF5671 domain-containing protein [Bryobacteraceae bacterium]
MQPAANLDTFIAAAKEKGASDESLVALLKQAGWPARDVLAALRRYYEEATGVSLPARGGSGESAREAFLHLLAFCTLATWTFALGSLLFTLIDRTFPDPVTSVSRQIFVMQAIATEIASLLIAFPTYLLVSRSISRDSLKRPGASESPVTRWLTWLALLITAAVIIGDLIAFLTLFLRGELTVRFVLKVIVVAALAGGVFWYYLGSLGAVWRPANRLFASVAAASVIAAIIAGFVQIGPPARQRSLAADQRRVEHLHRFVQEARNSWVASSTLPQTLPYDLRDPVTGAAYEYRIRSGPQYELCAVFDTEGDAELFYTSRRWYHRAGRHCYQLDARVLP